METLLVTCPETEAREEIECITARDGEPLVILRCSRFDPPEAVTCAGTCIHCREPAFDGKPDPWRMFSTVTG